MSGMEKHINAQPLDPVVVDIAGRIEDYHSSMRYVISGMNFVFFE